MLENNAKLCDCKGFHFDLTGNVSITGTWSCFIGDFLPTHLNVQSHCCRVSEEAASVRLSAADQPLCSRLKYLNKFKTHTHVTHSIGITLVISSLFIQLYLVYNQAAWWCSGLRCCLPAVWSLHVPPVCEWVFCGHSGFLPQPNELEEERLCQLENLNWR